MTDTPKNTPPPSLRSGDLKEMANAVITRNEKNFRAESFPYFLQSLLEDQSCMFKKKRPKQETLNQQLDTLDAMFTYLTLHADRRGDNSHSYLMALRAQKQFCSTLKEIQNLKFPKPSKNSLSTPPHGEK